MNKFLTKLIILLELVIGVAFFMAGISAFFGYFILNALLCVIGFFVFTDGLSKIDNPDDRPKPNDSNEENKI